MSLFQDLFIQIDFGSWKPVLKSTWKTLKYEGWLEEAEIGSSLELVELKLDIPEEDETGLISFNDRMVEKYNQFDIELKEKYGSQNIIDLIDYDKGTITIVKRQTNE